MRLSISYFFSDGVVESGSKFAIINSKGKVLIDFEYDKIAPYGNYYIVVKGEKAGIINSKF